MPETTYRVDRYQFSATDTLFLDTNVWLFIHSPLCRPTDRRTVLYSAAYKRILEVGCRIFLDALVLSEFVNVFVRWAFNSLSPERKPQEYKAFRKSPAFKPVAKSIVDACRRIVAVSTSIETGFTSIDIDALLTRYGSGKIDLNDHILAELCRRRGLTLVTDDGDFRAGGLRIVTANKRLLT